MGLITRIPGSNFSDETIPKIYRDGAISAGTLAMFDFADNYCWPTQGDSLTGSTLRNLVYDGPSANTGGTFNFDGGGFDLPGSAGGEIDLGLNYDLGDIGSPDFLAVIWFKQSNDFSTANYQALFGKSISTSVGNCQWIVDMGVGGRSPRVTIGSATGTGFRQFAGLGTNFGPTQIAFALSAGKLRIFKNGAEEGDGVDFSGSLKPLLATKTRIGAAGSFANFKGRVYRAFVENLTVSGTDAAERVTSDWYDNSTRFA